MMKTVPMTQVVLARLLVLTFLLSRTTQQGSTSAIYTFRENLVYEISFPETGGVQGWVWPQENHLYLKLTLVYATKTETYPVFYFNLTHTFPGRWWQIALFRENDRTALLLVQGGLSYRMSVDVKNVSRVNFGSSQKGFFSYGPYILLSTVCSLNATTDVTSGTSAVSTNSPTVGNVNNQRVVPTNSPTVEPIKITPAVPTGVPTSPSVITYLDDTIIPPDAEMLTEQLRLQQTAIYCLLMLVCILLLTLAISVYLNCKKRNEKGDETEGKDIKMRGIQQDYQDVQGPSTRNSDQYHKYYIPVNNVANDRPYDYVLT